MKIGIVDSLSVDLPFGGQQLEILSYAHVFWLLGHEVKVFFNDGVQDKVEAAAKHFDIRWNEDKVYSMKEIKNYDLDLLFVGYTWIRLPRSVRDIPVISWWIDSLVFPNAKEFYGISKRWPFPHESFRNVVDIWCLSETQKRLLIENYDVNGRDITVFPAPLDYSIFRCAARPWNERFYDICFIGRNDPVKNIKAFYEIATLLDDNKFLLITPEKIESLLQNVKFSQNPTRLELASLLSNSKILLTTSICEVCPLIIYEALNAGCTIVSNDVGSQQEQVGDCGFIYHNDDYTKAKEIVMNSLENPTNTVVNSISRGLSFDRSNILLKLEARLRLIERRRL